MFFFFNDTATTEIYTLSLHDALPIYSPPCSKPTVAISYPTTCPPTSSSTWRTTRFQRAATGPFGSMNTCVTSRARSEEHTSELQSRQYLVCRLLLEKNKTYSHSPTLA